MPSSKVKYPVSTLDELTVAEGFPFMVFPSSLEQPEMKSPDESLVFQVRYGRWIYLVQGP